MDDIDFIAIIISMYLHNEIRIMFFYSMLHSFLHYSQQRTPEYQIEMPLERAFDGFFFSDWRIYIDSMRPPLCNEGKGIVS